MPALIFNLDYTHGILTGHNIAASFMVLGSALFIEGARHLRSAVLSPVLVVASLYLVYVNTKSAMRNYSAGSEAASEAKTEKFQAGSQVASQRVALGRRIEVQVKLAGWTGVGALEAQLAEVVASDATQWRASRQCEAPNGPLTGAFCTKVATAKAKVEAAKERDRLQKQLDDLPVPTVEAPIEGQKRERPVTDAYATNTVALLTEVGLAGAPSEICNDDCQKRRLERLVKAEEALSRALGFELLAALGPTVWLAFIEKLSGAAGAPGAAAAKLKNLTGRRRKSAEPVQPEASTPSEPKQAAAPVSSADDIDRFIADELEVGVPDVRMRAGEIRVPWLQWCQARGIDPKREDELWKRLKVMPGVKHDPNNNRPRYLGVRRRVKGPTLVVSNGGVLGLMTRRSASPA